LGISVAVAPMRALAIEPAEEKVPVPGLYSSADDSAGVAVPAPPVTRMPVTVPPEDTGATIAALRAVVSEPVLVQVLADGEYTSAEASTVAPVPVPPATRTLPFGRSASAAAARGW